jgi:hypothetical protein
MRKSILLASALMLLIACGGKKTSSDDVAVADSGMSKQQPLPTLLQPLPTRQLMTRTPLTNWCLRLT